jgi:hypothetical protein
MPQVHHIQWTTESSQPGGKRSTTEQEDIFFHRSLRTPRPTAGVTSTAKTSKFQRFEFQRRRQSSSAITKLLSTSIRNISAIVDTGAQVTTIPESAVSKMPNAHNHCDAPPGTVAKYGNGELEKLSACIGHYEVQVTPGKPYQRGPDR